MALGFLFFYFSFLLINVQTELNNRKLKKLFIQNFSVKQLIINKEVQWITI